MVKAVDLRVPERPIWIRRIGKQTVVVRQIELGADFVPLMMPPGTLTVLRLTSSRQLQNDDRTSECQKFPQKNQQLGTKHSLNLLLMMCVSTPSPEVSSDPLEHKSFDFGRLHSQWLQNSRGNSLYLVVVTNASLISTNMNTHDSKEHKSPLITRKHFEFIRVKAEPKRALVRPHVDQSKPISGIDLIALFIVVESGDIIQGFCYAAPNSRYLDSLRFAASATATGTAIAITHAQSNLNYHSKDSVPALTDEQGNKLNLKILEKNNKADLQSNVPKSLLGIAHTKSPVTLRRDLPPLKLLDAIHEPIHAITRPLLSHHSPPATRPRTRRYSPPVHRQIHHSCTPNSQNLSYKCRKFDMRIHLSAPKLSFPDPGD
nr:hypothetical protein Iba_chr11eCG15460 [Ipomoea batatas]